jgi:tetratricopeptide (TPR) repeat protein
MLRRRGLLSRAHSAAMQAVELDPAQASGWSNLGAIEFERGNFGQAEEACRAALKLDASRAHVWNGLGNALQRQLRDAEAHAAFAEAVRLDPHYVDAIVNDALCWRDAGDLKMAMKRINEALQIAPDHANAHLVRALLYFLKGDVARGRVEYEWRLAQPGAMPRDLPGARWRGEDIAGRHLLVFAEQGLGDVIQALRYIAPLTARGIERITLHVPKALRRLVEENFPGVHVTATPATAVGVDFHCAVMSLPLLIEGPKPDGAAQQAYMSAASERLAAWQARFASVTERKIGLVWAGNPTYQSDYMRSMAADDLLPLLGVRNCRFYSLQVGPAARGIDALKPHVEDLSMQVSTMSDAAAAIAALDLVIAVDTSLAHLGGALGRPVWLMLPHVPDWRWGMSGDTHPLYANTRLFRQRRRGDWAGVIGDIRQSLEQM